MGELMQHINWHYIEIGLYVMVALFILYVPPKTTQGLGAFIEAHFGDSVGFYILHLGIILVVLGGCYPQVKDISQTGNSLILAGMVALKLTKVPPNGNGGNGSSGSSSSTAATPPDPAKS